MMENQVLNLSFKRDKKKENSVFQASLFQKDTFSSSSLFPVPRSLFPKSLQYLTT